MNERIFIGLGSNLGDRERNLREALAAVRALPGTAVVCVSRFYETEPWGEVDQPAFVNAVAELRSHLPPETLLEKMKRIESDLGRVESYRWGPRLIDLDLLLYGERRVSQERLTLPHPGILQRDFVMIPLAEIAPEILGALRRAALPL